MGAVQKQVDGKRVTTERVPVYKCANDHLSTDRESADALVTNVFKLMVKFDVQGHQLMPINRQGHTPMFSTARPKPT